MKARADFQATHQRVIKALAELWSELGGLRPLHREVAQRAGVSVATVKRHTKRITPQEITATTRLDLRRVLASLADEAAGGNVEAARLWLQVTGNLPPEKLTDCQSGESETLPPDKNDSRNQENGFSVTPDAEPLPPIWEG